MTKNVFNYFKYVFIKNEGSYLWAMCDMWRQSEWIVGILRWQINKPLGVEQMAPQILVKQHKVLGENLKTKKENKYVFVKGVSSVEVFDLMSVS